MSSPSNLDSSSEKDNSPLEERLAQFPNEKLVQEVISVWDEVIRIEQELANSRQRTRALELELASMDLEQGDGPTIIDLEEQLRVMKMRCGQLEAKLEKHAGNLQRAAVELAKDWRSDKFLRRLEALMAVADKKHSFIISGTGDVLEPEDGIIGIGSGGNYALAAAKVLIETDISAEEIARKSIKVASDICVFTNNNVTVEKV